MKSLQGKFPSARGWALLLILFLGAGLLVAACGEDSTPTTPEPPEPTPTPPPPPEPDPPATPTGLQVSGVTENSITWTWNAVTGAIAYQVQASTDANWDDSDNVTFDGQPYTSQTTYTHSGLEPETSVHVRVRAVAGTPSAPLLSENWSAAVTGTSAVAAPQALPAPTGLAVSKSESDALTWSWDAVSGATGYQVQVSDSASFSDDDPSAFVSGTSYRAANREPATSYSLRVRAYAGALSAPEPGTWSAGVQGTTEDAPPPEPLSTPTGVSGGNVTGDSIVVSWNSVDDADTYLVQQRESDGDWTAASCGADGDNVVTTNQCTATGLTAGTSYAFRVRAVPASAASDQTFSAWSTSSSSISTAGTPPRPPVPDPDDDDLNITWESDDDSITWYWDPASDRRITYLVALLRGNAKTPQNRRPSCPALTNTTNIFADLGAGTDSNGWFSDEASKSATSRTLSWNQSEYGAVRGLCVVRTWMDANDNSQYGTVSSAWATTSPPPPGTLTPSAAVTEKVDNTNKTLRLNWDFTIDQGFLYQTAVASADVTSGASDVGPCSDATQKGKTHTAVRDNATATFEQSDLAVYEDYRVCVRANAENGQGSSDWTDLGTYETRAGAPTSLKAEKNISVETTAVTGNISWSFSANAQTPEGSDSFEYKVLDNTSDTSTAPPTCAADTTTTTTSPTSGDDFDFTTGINLTRQSGQNAKQFTVTYRACVRVDTAGGDEDRKGPWGTVSETVTVSPQSQ